MKDMQMREAFSRSLADYGSVNEDVVVLDADTGPSTLSTLFAERFPERFFDVGIAEPCLVDVAVGLALGGKIPFANAFAALVALRALEEIRTCICYGHANVKLAATYAGLSDYKDGPTHHSITDIAIMRSLPEMTVIVPADAAEAAQWVPIVAEHKGPIYIRISRAATPVVHEPSADGDQIAGLAIGQGLQLREGQDITLVACGSMVGRVMEAAVQLDDEGIDARVLEMHTVKPIDKELLWQAAKETGAMVTAEEHSVIGGLGGAVAEALAEGSPAPLERVGIRDHFARTAPSHEALMAAYGLTAEAVAEAARRALARKG
jgi:transketolase